MGGATYLQRGSLIWGRALLIPINTRYTINILLVDLKIMQSNFNNRECLKIVPSRHHYRGFAIIELSTIEN